MQRVVETQERSDFSAGAVIEILAPIGLVPVSLHGGGDYTLHAWEEISNWNGRNVCIGSYSCFVEGLAGPPNVFCGGGVFAAVWACAVAVLVDRDYDVRRHFASTKDRLEVSFFFMVEAFVDFRGLRIDLPKTS